MSHQARRRARRSRKCVFQSERSQSRLPTCDSKHMASGKGKTDGRVERLVVAGWGEAGGGTFAEFLGQ